MLARWIPALVSCLVIGHALPARAEDSITADPQVASSPELVHIYSIGGRAMATHPSMINVLPGEQVSLRADVLQFGNACPHPEGCPEGRGAEEFLWSASDRAGDDCSARSPESCRDRTSFQPQGTEMIFHIPYAMGADVTLTVSHQSLSSRDTIVLHNAHFSGMARSEAYPATPPGYYEDNRDDRPIYPTIAPSGIDEPYCGPYYPYSSCWGPYPYYSGVWWGWGGPGFAIGVGFYGPGWWGYPHYWGGYPGYYHPGIYGYYHPGWWHPGYAVAAGPRLLAPVGPRFTQRVGGPVAVRPGGYGMRPTPANVYRVRRGYRRRR